jgi:anti-sigma factor ChrR (cupin superfamily)
VAEEVFVLEGIYEDLDGRYGPGAYLRYPRGSSHNARSTTGCTFLVVNNKIPKPAAS